MRGTVSSSASRVMRPRITPACAGNRVLSCSSGIVSKDHPRVCGEQMRQIREKRGISGSPPRVRGTDGGDAWPSVRARITPACAGNRRCSWPCRTSHWDHPRVCGEQQKVMQLRTWLIGSPPRVRGTEDRLVPGLYSGRITPACAGNRALDWLAAGLCEDHPRVCGEQAITAG